VTPVDREPTLRTPDIVVLGNLIVDDLVFADGTTRMREPGGAVAYVAHGARLWNVPVGLVAPLGTDYPQGVVQELGSHGVETLGLRPLGRPGLHTWLLHEPRGRRVVHRLNAATHLDASPLPGDVPAAWRSPRALHLAPMPLARQRALVDALAEQAGYVSVDPHELVTDATRGAWRDVLARVDCFMPNDEELEGAADAPVEALHALCRPLRGTRLREVLLKRGARGGIAYDVASGAATEWAPRAVRMVDATGAGDAFAGGFLAARIEREDRAAAIEQGVVSASFALEDWGMAALRAATPAMAKLRQQSWFGMVASG
jgi:cytidine kinase